MSDAMDDKPIHPFERAGLGKAPYRFIGHEQKIFSIPGFPEATKPGGSCQYCWTSITDCYWLKSADGKKFYVGCDCIEKAGDAKLKSAIDRVIADRRNKARHKREDAATAELKALLESPETIERLKAMPHPKGFCARKTGAPLTMYDDVTWLVERCGAAGRIRLLKRLKEMLK